MEANPNIIQILIYFNTMQLIDGAELFLFIYIFISIFKYPFIFAIF